LEVVVAAPVRQPDREELLLRVALLHCAGHEPRSARRVAETELSAHLLAEPAFGQVFTGRRASWGVPEHARVELGCSPEQRPPPLVPLPLALLLGRCLLVLELDAEAPGEQLDRPHEVDVLDLLDERDRVAALAAAEALERAPRRRDGEARRSLLVEGTEPL